MTPLHNFVVVEREEKKETTASGFILSHSPTDKPIKGTVKYAGEACKYVKEGDTIIFKKYAPDEVEIENIKYLILEETDILAKL